MNRRQALFLITSQAAFFLMSVNGFAAKSKKIAQTPLTQGKIRIYSAEQGDYILTDKVIRSEPEWKKLLTSPNN